MTTQEILKNINESNWVETLRKLNLEVFAVGGVVRDLKLGKNPKDIDLIVTGGISIEKLATFLEDFGKVDLVGESFAVIKFKPSDLSDILDEPLDIAIPRTERKTGEGHKEFEVSTENVTLEQDLERRDFTINSIAMTLDGEFVDPFNGRHDLLVGTIKATNPEAFAEDPLRILRAIQFASRFEFAIEFETFQMMKDNVHLLKQITGERILGEFTKIVDKGGSVKTAFKLLANVGFFETFKIHTNKTMTVTDANFKTLGDFMYLLLFFEKDMDKILAERFKADNDTKKQVKALAHMHSRADEKVHARTIAAEMVKITPDAFSLGFIFSTVSEVFDMMKSGKLPSKITDLEISGDDMMELGFEGKGIGDGLKSLFDMVLFEKIPNDHSVLMSVATKMKNPKSKRLKGDVETFKNQAKLMSDKVKSIDMQIVSLKQKKKEMKRDILKAELEAAKSKVWYEEYLVSDYMKLKQKDMEGNELMQTIMLH